MTTMNHRDVYLLARAVAENADGQSEVIVRDGESAAAKYLYWAGEDVIPKDAGHHAIHRFAERLGG